MWDRNNWFLGMDLAVVRFIDRMLLLNLVRIFKTTLSVELETGVFSNI